jgi:hypothetical protein
MPPLLIYSQLAKNVNVRNNAERPIRYRDIAANPYRKHIEDKEKYRLINFVRNYATEYAKCKRICTYIPITFDKISDRQFVPYGTNFKSISIKEDFQYEKRSSVSNAVADSNDGDPVRGDRRGGYVCGRIVDPGPGGRTGRI